MTHSGKNDKREAKCRKREINSPAYYSVRDKKLSYDQLEYSLKLGQIPVGRSNFYMFWRQFYADLSKELNCRDSKLSQIILLVC